MKRKFIYSTAIASLLAVASLSACSGNPGTTSTNPGTSETTSQTKTIVVNVTGPLTLESGKSASMTASVAGTSRTTVRWSIDNTNVASIDQTGVLTANVVEENVDIIVTATSVEDENAKGTFKVTITPFQKTISLGLDGSIYLDIEESYALAPTFTGFKDGNPEVGYVSSDTSIAEVDANGRITAKKYGTVLITATVKDTNISDIAVVTVYYDDFDDVNQYKSLSKVGGQRNITQYNITYALNAEDLTIRFSSRDKLNSDTIECYITVNGESVTVRGDETFRFDVTGLGEITYNMSCGEQGNEIDGILTYINSTQTVVVVPLSEIGFTGTEQIGLDFGVKSATGDWDGMDYAGSFIDPEVPSDYPIINAKKISPERKAELIDGYAVAFANPELANAGDAADDFYVGAEKTDEKLNLHFIGFGNFSAVESIYIVIHKDDHVAGTGWGISSSDVCFRIYKTNAKKYTGNSTFWEPIDHQTNETPAENTPTYTKNEGYFTIDFSINWSELGDITDKNVPFSMLCMEFGTGIYDASPVSYGMTVLGDPIGDPAMQGNYPSIDAYQTGFHYDDDNKYDPTTDTREYVTLETIGGKSEIWNSFEIAICDTGSELVWRVKTSHDSNTIGFDPNQQIELYMNKGDMFVNRDTSTDAYKIVVGPNYRVQPVPTNYGGASIDTTGFEMVVGDDYLIVVVPYTMLGIENSNNVSVAAGVWNFLASDWDSGINWNVEILSTYTPLYA